MDQSTKQRIELAIGSQIDKQAWDADIISVMSDQLVKYLDIAGGEVPDEYLHPVRREISLCELLKEDLHYFSQRVPEVKALADHIEIFQFNGNTPQASVLLAGENGGVSYIGVSTAYIKFIHLFFSKFFTLTEPYREGNIHDDYLDEIKQEKWDCLSVYLSILNDAAAYGRIDYDKEIKKYKYLYQPYDYCDLVIAARQFGLLHEIAHLYIRQNFEQDYLNNQAEEYFADQIAYSWLVDPFLQKDSLSETERYNLSIRVQAPLYYFVAEFFPFAVHHWDADKIAVLRQRERDFYRIHPLRREMALMSGAKDQPIFSKHKEMAHYLYVYLCKEHIAHDPDTFFRDKFGPAGLMAFTYESDDLYRVMECIQMARADAYHAYSELDGQIAGSHGEAMAWLEKRVLSFHRKGKDWDATQLESAWSEINRVTTRRMGQMKDYGALKKVTLEHEQVFSDRPLKCYDISLKSWKKGYGIMQLDLVVVSELKQSEVSGILSKQEEYVVSAKDFSEMRNLDGDLPMLLFNVSADFVIGTSAGIFAAYLYDLLKSLRAKRVRIGGEDVALIKETVEKAVIDAIRLSQEAEVDTGEENIQ